MNKIYQDMKFGTNKCAKPIETLIKSDSLFYVNVELLIGNSTDANQFPPCEPSTMNLFKGLLGLSDLRSI